MVKNHPDYDEKGKPMEMHDDFIKRTAPKIDHVFWNTPRIQHFKIRGGSFPEMGILITACLKNYEKQIENFIDWIKDFIELRDKEVIGFIRSESDFANNSIIAKKTEDSFEIEYKSPKGTWNDPIL